MARFIAFYLPQFHPVKENNEWWGQGFTEWVNVAKARPLFRGHKQPHLPADLGFYDLRMPEVRQAQADLARNAGIEGFCYWHYWFGNGRTILERPFQEVLKTGSPNFPFCLGWANESWSNKSWKVAKRSVKMQVLLEQTYSEEDIVRHFNYVLPAFKDERYIKVDGKPLFYIYRPLNLPDAKHFIEVWNKLAQENGLRGVFFVGMSANVSYREVGKQGSGKVRIPRTDMSGEYYNYILKLGFDAVNSRGNSRAEFVVKGRYLVFLNTIIRKFLGINLINKYNQEKINNNLFVNEDCWDNVFPTIMPNWDRSPRSGKHATVYVNSTPEVFGKCVRQVCDLVKNKPQDHQIVFIQSWNEWGEGNYLEPDIDYGKGFLEALKNNNKQ